MNIIQIGPYPITANCIKGGVEASVYGLSQELAKLHTIDVFDIPRLDGKDTVESYQNLIIHRYRNKGKYNKDAIHELPSIIRDIVTLGPDVCHIHGTGPFSLALYKALRYYGIPTIVTVHGLLTVEKRNALLKRWSLKGVYQYLVQSKAEKELLDLCPQVIVDTEYVANVIRGYKLKNEPKMAVIPQGINPHYFQIDSNPLSNTILSVGTISKRKGHLLLLQSFDALCKKVSNTTLKIIGVVAEADYLNQIEAYINNSPNKNRIELMTNASQNDIFEAYQSARIFALHSQEESQGIVFAEAMAAGLPIVATKVGGVPYVVNNNENGFLADYGDTSSFANYLEMLYIDEKLCDKIKKCNKNESKKYDWSAIADRVIELYQIAILDNTI